MSQESGSTKFTPIEVLLEAEKNITGVLAAAVNLSRFVMVLIKVPLLYRRSLV